MIEAWPVWAGNYRSCLTSWDGCCRYMVSWFPGLVARDYESVLFLHMVLSLSACIFNLSKRRKRENRERGREGGKMEEKREDNRGRESTGIGLLIWNPGSSKTVEWHFIGHWGKRTAAHPKSHSTIKMMERYLQLCTGSQICYPCTALRDHLRESTTKQQNNQNRERPPVKTRKMKRRGICDE